MNEKKDLCTLTEEILILKNYSKNTRYNYMRIIRKFVDYMNRSSYPPEEKIRCFLMNYKDKNEQLILQEQVPYNIKMNRNLRLIVL